MRELILKALKQEKTVSGQELGERLNISRSAVWKHIKEFRSQGYEIASSPQAGYSLIKNTPLLLAAEIESGLNTQFIGKRILHFSEVPSTQDIAAQLAIEGALDGTVVISEMQTNGRGRKGRSWLSLPEGGIYLSIILRPRLMPSQAVQIPLVAGVALANAIIKTASLQPQIKWPNDIVIGKKKVAGILTEMSSEIDGIKYVILGIGLNVNIPGSLFTGQNAGIATSLLSAGGKSISRAQLVQGFLNEFETIYMQYLTSGFISVRETWKNLNNTLGSRVKVDNAGKEIQGEAIDIDNEGFLLVKTDVGDICRVISGDVFITDPVDRHIDHI